MKAQNLRLLVIVMGMCIITTVLLALIAFLAINARTQEQRILDLENELATERSLQDDEEEVIPVSETFNTEWIVNTKTDLVETEQYKVDITYPELINPNNPVVAASVNGYVNSLILNYKQDVTTAETMGGGQSTIELDFDLRFLNDKFISILVSGSNYLGGAHPNGVYFSINYDLLNNKPLLISDLFNPDSGYLNVLSEASASELVETIGVDIPEDFIIDGTAPIADNFKVFNLTDTALVITFPEYQVAPYAFGPQTVVLEMSGVNSYFNSEFAALL